ncbi:MAG: hypothetical protein FJW26_08905 [Acidimicrobiia bacterium]|nr:hypothetical protein [Acidimicrobiia bacterium]
MNWIAEHEEGTIAINAGFEAYRHREATIREMSQLQFETLTPWRGVRHDVYTFRFASAHLREHEPRVLFLGFGERDDWAHDGDYELVLDALHQADNRFRRLWEFLEGHRSYRGKTSIVISTDHGRGNGPADWKSHGKDIEGAQYIWLGIVSLDSAKLGEQSNTETIYQNQIAATLCRFLGIDYSRHNPAAGKPVDY